MNRKLKIEYSGFGAEFQNIYFEIARRNSINSVPVGCVPIGKLIVRVGNSADTRRISVVQGKKRRDGYEKH